MNKLIIQATRNIIYQTNKVNFATQATQKT